MLVCHTCRYQIYYQQWMLRVDSYEKKKQTEIQFTHEQKVTFLITDSDLYVITKISI